MQTSAVTAEDVSPVRIATVWNASSVIDANGKTDIDFRQASKVIQWQRSGFLAGLRDGPGDFPIDEVLISERDNLSQATSDFADLFNTGDIIMMIGASTELNTMYAAMVTSFFEVPILIPFSDGELFADSNHGYVMRLTPTAQRYADFIGDELLDVNLTQRINSILFQDKPVPDYAVKAAIFFADDFNDHESAVKITQKIMDNGVDMTYYKAYPDKQLLTSVRTAWENDKDQLEDADVVIIIPQDKDAIVELASIVSLWSGSQVPPAFILIGYVPEYTDTVIFNSDNVYVLRQKNDKSNCPEEIVHHESAMGYAAGYITRLAVSKALEKAGKEPKGWRLWLKTSEQKRQVHESYLSSLRTEIVTVMRGINESIPCLGRVSFITSDEDLTELELIRYVSVDQSVPVDNSEIFYRIVNRLRAKYGITEW